MNASDLLLWVALPYVAFTTFIVGHYWRYKHDQFGWTTRSSQLHERTILRIASPMFHFGFLAVIGGHFIGLAIPYSWTEAAGISDHAYHLVAVSTGSVAGLLTIAGVVLLIYRRRNTNAVFRATTVNDKTMYIFLMAALLLGCYATLNGAGVVGHTHNYREDVSVWFRSLFILQPKPDLMTDVPLAFKIHIVAGLTMFIVWPFTRLVHALSVPLQYFFRPYIVYRSRDAASSGNRPARRGWERLVP